MDFRIVLNGSSIGEERAPIRGKFAYITFKIPRSIVGGTERIPVASYFINRQAKERTIGEP